MLLNHYQKAIAWLTIAKNSRQLPVIRFALDKFEHHALQAAL